MAAEASPAQASSDSRRIAIDVKPQPEAQHPLGRQLVAYWTAARDAGRPLARADLPSRAILKLMPHLFLLEPNNDGSDWRFRIFGTAIVSRFGGDATNRFISQVYDPAQARDQASIYKGVTARGEPHVTQGRIAGIDRQFLKIEFCHVPVVPPQPGLSWILGGAFVFELPD
jgi:hypothetical protein